MHSPSIRFFRDRPTDLIMQEPRPSKLASYAVAQRSGSEIPQRDLNILFQPYASSAKTNYSFPGKGGKSMRVKRIACRNELNLDHWIFEYHSGPVKCFSCSAMMEVRSSGGEVSSINPLAVFETKGNSPTLTEERI